MPGSRRFGEKFLAAIPFIAGLLLYYPSLKFQWIDWDAPSPVSQVFVIRSFAWDSLRWIFSSFQQGCYDPGALTAWMLEFRLFGFHPAGYHSVSLFLHSLNAALAAIFLMRLRLPAWAALWAGILFAVHPVQVESVAWISSQKILFSAVFLFLSILQYVDFLEKGTRRNYAGSFLFYLLAVSTQWTAAAMPLVLILLHAYVANERRNFFAATIPFFCLALAKGALAFLACRTGTETAMAWSVAGLSKCALAFLWVLAAYAKEIFCFSPFEIFGKLKDIGWGNLFCILPGAASAGVLMLVFLGRRRFKTLAFLSGWYVVWLLPFLCGLGGGSPVAARHLYLSVLGPFAVSGMLIAWFAGKSGRIIVKAGVAGAVAFLSVVCGYVSGSEMTRWRDSETLWSSEIARFPQNERACAELGSVYLEKGDLDRGIGLLAKALSLNPADDIAANNLVSSYRLKKDYSRAKDLAGNFLKKNPSDAKFLIQLGLIESENNSANAADYFDKAIRTDPENPFAQYANGCFYLYKLDKPSQAYPFFLECVRLNPYHPDFLIAIADCSSRGGFYDQAISALHRAVVLNPLSLPAWYNLGQLLRLSGDEISARDALEKAFKIDSDPMVKKRVADVYRIGFARN
ncbi:MAG TPA: tetratricopeptide repeat protein [Candidatus Omnitrophota bacterium]|nr:tetratricopeptide repeat protein [Candidatus Omnitrophota bacterium]